MTHSLRRGFFVLAPLVLFFALLHIAHAQCAGGSSGSLCPPTKFSNIAQFVEATLRALVTIGLPIVTFFYVYAGFKFLAAQGNASKLEEAKMNFVYVTIGAIFILGAWVIATLIAGTVQQLTTSAPSGSSTLPPTQSQKI